MKMKVIILSALIFSLSISLLAFDVPLEKMSMDKSFPAGWVVPAGKLMESTNYRENGTIQNVGSCMWQGMSNVFVSGDSVWCSFQDGLSFIDISDISNPAFLSKVYTPFYTLKQGQIIGSNDILVEGNYAYIGDHEGVRIVNLNDMELISTFSLTRAHCLYLVGTNLYVVDGTGLWVLDVSDPAVPESMGFYAKPGAVGLDIVGNYAYVSDTGGTGLTILDISTPENPNFVSDYTTPGHGNKIAVANGYAFIADHNNGLEIVDVSNPLMPVFNSNVAFSGAVTNLEIIDSQYVVISASTPSSIEVVDISDPDNPFVAASYGGSGNLFLDGNRLFIVSSNSISVQDVQYPLSFTLEGSIVVETYYSRGIQVSGDFAYIVDMGDWFNSGLNIVDISDPNNPYPRGNYSLGYPSFSFILAVKDNYAYIPDIMNDLLNIVDVSNPDQPMYAGEYEASVEDLFAGETYTYLLVDNTLQITDLQVPSNPSLISSITLGTEDGSKIFVVNGYAFIGDSAGEVWIVDVSDALNPQMITSFNAAGEVAGIFAVEDLLYVVSQEQLQIVDISVVNTPQIVGSYFDDDLSSYSDIYVNGEYAYIANLIGGFLEIDVSNPETPFREEFFQTAGWCRGLAYANDYLYVSTDCSFQILTNELVGSIDDYIITCSVTEYELANHPNPFNPETTISFSLNTEKNTEIVIYNIKGQKVKTLINEKLDAGTHNVVWNGKDENGKSVTSGIYFYQFKAGKDFSQTKRMILLK